MSGRYPIWRLRPQREAALGVVLLVILGLSPAAASETRLQGVIRQDQVWAEEKQPFRLAGEVTIERGVTVTILPGVAVRFDKGSRLLVKGHLTADDMLLDGTEDMYNREKIVFAPGSRGRLTGSVIQNLELRLLSDQVAIENNVIANRNGSGITVGKACRPTIVWNDFYRNSYYAVYNEGQDVIRVPNNFWGAANGPSGAGPGNGNAVNPSVDFRPFQRSDIAAHLILTVRQLSKRRLYPGSRMILTYDIENMNSYDHTVILGASIYQNPEAHIHSPPHDIVVSIKPGRHRFTRPFTIPADTPAGRYDVLWGIMKTDLTAYHVLAKDPGILHIGTEAAMRPGPADAPGWVPVKGASF